ncbi:MAG TPA: T9SS type A sorting domain-containing protein, partial [Ignavibacteriaceae bacterium]|nr:T9SS type A sorting domain-containing protein [Ignavibacteriaceae bacterium]
DENADVAFDWYPEQSWVSHWVWQTTYNPAVNPTIFNNSNENTRSNLLRDAVTNRGNGYSPKAKILRFMENNDQWHFITHHGLARTCMVAALEFSLNGVPLVYNGQEIGVEGHPYDIEYTFLPGFPIDHFDPDHLFPYYQNIIHWRKTLPALYEGDYEEISVTPGQKVFSFRRFTNDQNVITILNMGSSSVNVTASIPVNEMNLDSSTIYYLTDILTGDYLSGLPSEFAALTIPLDGFSAKVYLIADSVVQVTGIKEIVSDVADPESFEVAQNYPNPFNPFTNINYSIPKSGRVTLRVYDILGEEVATLINSDQNAGYHSVSFDGSKYSSGVYIYRVEFAYQSFTKKMMLLK